MYAGRQTQLSDKLHYNDKNAYRNLFQISGHIFPLCISLNTNTPISATYKPVHPRASSNLQQSGWKLLLLLLLLHFQTRKL